MKLLIADDEPLIRRGIRYIIENSPLSFSSIYEAASGREAVKLAEVHKPEIMLMDIKMPGMDGLSAAKEINKLQINCIIVFLTAYGRFDFAREAVRCRARDYLVKPVTPDDLISTLNNCLQEAKQNQFRLYRNQKLSETLTSARESIEKSIVHGLVTGTFTSREHLSSQLDILWTDPSAPRFNEKQVPNVCLVLQWPKPLTGDIAKNLISQLHMKINYPLVTDIIDGRLVVLTSLTGLRVNKENTIEVLKEIVDFCRQLTPGAIKAGIGRVYNNPLQLRHSYDEALLALNYCLKIDQINSSIIHFKDVNTDRLFSRPYQTVQQATSYIASNFDRKISLEEVAQHVYLNPTYLSTIIKQETGRTFTDFVTCVRVGKAKDLLNSKLAVKEVARKVGYKDSNYFCRVFKKVTGVTPTDFRTNNLHKKTTGWS